MEKGNSVWVALCDPDFQRQIPEKAREAVRGFVALITSSTPQRVPRARSSVR
jgi:DNA helicase-2/ATP-dependent DNA helicase PcrA